MAAYLGQQNGHDDAALVTERILDEVRRTYDGFDGVYLERVVREAVADLWTDSIQVTTFVPVLAMRQIRDVLEAREVVPIEATARSA
jgi:hypothetical protein